MRFMLINSIFKCLFVGFILTIASLSEAKAQKKPHVVFLVSRDIQNYQAHRTIPEFAEKIKGKGFYTTVIEGAGEQHAYHFPGLEVLKDADLLVIFCRRVALS